MKVKFNALKKVTAAILSGAMVLSYVTVAGITKVNAALSYWPESLPISNEFYYENESLQPYGHAFQPEELLNWSPDNDPDARYNKGSVPLKDRWMGPSVNKDASRDATIIPLAMSNANAHQSPSQGANNDFAYAFTNFQYVDNYNFWGGASETGPIAIPTPEHIDSAHRNGVKATGTIFIPWGDSTYGNKFLEILTKKNADGTFPAADKLIEIAQYYGFDGYVINHESGSSATFTEFLKYIQNHKPENFTMTFYNGSSSLNSSSISSYLQDGNQKVNDDWWLDMSWYSPSSTAQNTLSANRSPFDVHASWEYFPMSGGSLAKGGSYKSLLGSDNKLFMSLGILAPTVTLTNSSDSDDFQNVQDQLLWTGSDSDPTAERPASGWCGFSKLVADKTPVLGTEFATTFTAGNGYKFYEDGKVIGKKTGWYNRSLTDIMPTWRWIIESEGSKLSPKIDYDDAWYAGTSLKVSGNLDANKSNHLKLYSSQLDITDKTKFSITYKTPSTGVDMQLGLCFGETYDESNFKFYDVDTVTNGEWTTKTVDLSADAGKRAIAISLKFNSTTDVQDCVVNVGRMAFTTSETAPAASAKVTLDEAIYIDDDTAEARAYWDKAENAAIYRIYRVHADGTRELIGATPNNAFYLGKFDKDGNETDFNFEVTSYSETGIKGGTQTLNFKWKTITNGYEVTTEQGENIALKKPGVSSATTASDGPVDKLNDGVIPSSKWCVSSSGASAVIDLGKTYDISRWVVYHANAPGAGEGIDFNTVDFNLQYAADDGEAILNPSSYTDKNRVLNLSFTRADTVSGNTANITDRVLSQTIQARYIKLNITNSCNCPWVAVRVYEFELYEKPWTPHSTTLLERNVKVTNNVGDDDTVFLNNVNLPNGSTEATTGNVKLYDSLTAETPIATGKATMVSEMQKQRYKGSVELPVKLNPDGGRLYYTTDINGEDSLRYSVEYGPETGTAIKEATSINIKRSMLGTNTYDKDYGVMTFEGLEAGTQVRIFDAQDGKAPILFSKEAVDGEAVVMERVPLTKAGGKVYYELRKSGSPDSARLEYTYDATNTLPVNSDNIKYFSDKYSGYDASLYTTDTFQTFQTALNDYKTMGNDVDADTFEVKRTALTTAAAQLRLRANTQRVEEISAQYAKDYNSANYTAASYKALTDVQATIATYAADNSNVTNDQVAKTYVAIEQAKNGLVVQAVPPVVTGVTVSPDAPSVGKGGTQNFTATVTGSNVNQSVTWTVSGNASDKTTISGTGKLTIGADETATSLTVTATSTDDTLKSGTATVTVTDAPTPPVGDDTNYALGATVLASSDTTSNTLDKLFDGKYASENDKWGVNGTGQWLAFESTSPIIPTSLVIQHAGAAGESGPGANPASINTAKYHFQVFDPTAAGKTEAEVLAMNATEMKSILSNASNWTTVVDKTSTINTLPTTTDAITATTPSSIYRIVVDQTDSTGWAEYVRLYELELYGAIPVPEATVTSVTVSPSVVTKNPGETHQFTALVDVQNGAATTVTWSVSGNNSASTIISNGLLFIGADETSNSLTVKATSTVDTTKSGTATVAVTQPTYAVYATIVGEAFGTISAGVTEASAGDTVNLTIKPNDGFAVKPGSLKLNGVALADNATSFVMPAGIARITVEFARPSYPITADPSITHGTITFSKNEGKLGDVVKITVTPDEGYQLVAGSLKEKTHGYPVMNPDSYTLYGEPIVITAKFEKINYNVTINSNVTNGTISADKTTAQIGDTVTLTVTPNDGYKLKEGSLKVNGEVLTHTTRAVSDTYTFTMPAGEVEVTAEFEKDNSTVTIGSITNGAIEADKATAQIGDTVTLTITPEEGYKLKEGSLKVNGQAIEGLTFTMPAGKVEITAEFEKIDYAVTINGELTNGSVVADTETAQVGDTVTLAVVPAEGYKLKEGSLKVNGVAIEGLTFTMPAGEVEITAEFEKITETDPVGPTDPTDPGTQAPPTAANTNNIFVFVLMMGAAVLGIFLKKRKSL